MAGLKYKEEKYKESMEASKWKGIWEMCKGKDEVNGMNR